MTDIAGVIVPQLLMNYFHLLPENIFLLVLIHTFLHAVLNLPAKLQDLSLRLHKSAQHIEATASAVLFQKCLTLIVAHREANHQLHNQPFQRLISKQRLHCAFSECTVQLRILSDAILQCTDHRFLFFLHNVPATGHQLDLSHQAGLQRRKLLQDRSLLALHQYADNSVRQLHDLLNGSHRTGTKQIVFLWIFCILILLTGQKNLAILIHRVFRRRN